MGTTADKLNKLKATKEAIRTAINNKGGTLTTSDKFSDYATAIDNIQSGSTNEPITITENGTYTAPDGVGYSPVNVNVPSKEEETKSITITENGTTTVLPTSGKVLSKVDIVANIPQSVASGTVKNLLDNTKSSSNLFEYYSGANVDSLISYSDTSNVTRMYHMFSHCQNLTTIPQLDTSKVTNMEGMFYECKNLTTIPQLDTSKVTHMGQMFYYCQNLTTVPQLDLSSCTYMTSMFYVCKALTSVSLLNTMKVEQMASVFRSCYNLATIKLDTSKATNIAQMFYECYKLSTIDFTHMNITNVYASDYFANSCYSLKKLIIRNMDTIPTLNSNALYGCYHFYGTQNDTYNPDGLKDGIIYVPDNKVEELKTATNWSVFADNIFPLSLLGKAFISNINSKSNNYIINKSSLFTILLFDFINTPEVIITSSNEQVATISDIVITTKKITFKANYLSIGVATITAQITGDMSATKTIDVNVIESMQYTVEKVDGATYGFELNSNGYYESTNKGKSNSYSLCKLVFNITEKFKALKLECINNGENGYDFGILSNIDTTLPLSNSIDSANVYKSFRDQSSTTPIIITYPEATVGEHFIYIKYRKDGSGNNGNDSLQFKVI